jgi:hypothetical protein
MPKIFKLAEVTSKNSAFLKAEIETFTDDENTYPISSLLLEINDLSDGSSEFERLAVNSDSTLKLSGTKTQYLKQLEFSGKNALEISADHGHVSRYLAENFDLLDSIKLNNKSTAASLRRCRDVDNVNLVFNDTLEVSFFSDFELSSYDLIFISDLELLRFTKKQASDFIAFISSLLDTSGLLLIEANNRERASKVFAYGKFPFSRAYESTVGQFSRSEWLAHIEQSGLACSAQYVALPNLLDPRSLLAKSYIDSSADSLNHFYNNSVVEGVSDYLYFKRFADHQSSSGSILSDACDGFIFIVSKQPAEYLNRFAFDYVHFSGTSRKRRWRTVTTKQASSDYVRKGHLFNFSSELETKNKIVHVLNQEVHQSGQLLAGLWSDAAITDPEELLQLIKDYYQWLTSFVKSSKSEESVGYYDLIPWNIVVKDDGQFTPFDQEWQIKDANEVDFIFFRALFWFAWQNPTLLISFANRNHLYDINDFIVFHFENLNIECDVQRYLKLESAIQSEFSENFDGTVLHDAMSMPICGYVNRFEHVDCVDVIVKQNPSSDGLNVRANFSQRIDQPEVEQTLVYNIDPVMNINNSGQIIKIHFFSEFANFAIRKVAFYSEHCEAEPSLELCGSDDIKKYGEMFDLVYDKDLEADHGNQIFPFVSVGVDPNIGFNLAERNIKKVGKIVITMAYQNKWYKHQISTDIDQRLRVQQEKILGLQVHAGEQTRIIDRSQKRIHELKAQLQKTQVDLKKAVELNDSGIVNRFLSKFKSRS